MRGYGVSVLCVCGSKAVPIHGMVATNTNNYIFEYIFELQVTNTASIFKYIV